MPNETEAQQKWFTTTHWSRVLTAKGADPQAGIALEELCQTYWYPLYCYVRRRGFTPEEAQDLTQEFFLRLLRTNLLAATDQNKGKFRSFLLASLKNFLANEWDRAHARKRGGNHTLISLDDDTAEERYALETTKTEDLDAFFDKRWALTILERALAALKQEFEKSGKAIQFEALKHFLTEPESCYDRVAAQLGIKPGTAAVIVYRMRQRYRELVRAEIANTVDSQAQLDDEMSYLLSVLTIQ